MIKLQTPRLLALVALFLAPAFSSGAYRSRPKTAFRHAVQLRSAPQLPERREARVSTGSAVHDFDLQPAGFTPYDPYLGSVRTVLANLDRRSGTIADACRLMRIAHMFAYAARDPYRADPPAMTAARRAGDCKAKALWLYDRLGDSSALYVIGKISGRSRAAHAWVYWQWDDRWWILDPTNRSAPIAADSVERGRYVPYYSFTRGAAYRHPATHLLNFAQLTATSVVAEGNKRR